MLNKTLFALGLCAIFATGCSGNANQNPQQSFTPAPATGTPSPGPAAIEKPPLPPTVTELQGTALGAASTDLQQAMTKPPEAQGAYFLLLSPSDPTKGVVVWGGADATPATLNKQATGQLNVSGNVKSFEDPSLAQVIKAKHGVDLTSEGSRIQYIVPSTALWPAASGTPTGTESPATPTPTDVDTRTPGAI